MAFRNQHSVQRYNMDIALRNQQHLANRNAEIGDQNKMKSSAHEIDVLHQSLKMYREAVKEMIGCDMNANDEDTISCFKAWHTNTQESGIKASETLQLNCIVHQETSARNSIINESNEIAMQTVETLTRERLIIGQAQVDEWRVKTDSIANLFSTKDLLNNEEQSRKGIESDVSQKFVELSSFNYNAMQSMFNRLLTFRSEEATLHKITLEENVENITRHSELIKQQLNSVINENKKMLENSARYTTLSEETSKLCMEAIETKFNDTILYFTHWHTETFNRHKKLQTAKENVIVQTLKEVTREKRTLEKKIEDIKIKCESLEKQLNENKNKLEYSDRYNIMLQERLKLYRKAVQQIGCCETNDNDDDKISCFKKWHTETQQHINKAIQCEKRVLICELEQTEMSDRNAIMDENNRISMEIINMITQESISIGQTQFQNLCDIANDMDNNVFQHYNTTSRNNLFHLEEQYRKNTELEVAQHLVELTTTNCKDINVKVRNVLNQSRDTEEKIKLLEQDLNSQIQRNTKLLESNKHLKTRHSVISVLFDHTYSMYSTATKKDEEFIAVLIGHHQYINRSTEQLTNHHHKEENERMRIEFECADDMFNMHTNFYDRKCTLTETRCGSTINELKQCTQTMNDIHSELRICNQSVEKFRAEVKQLKQEKNKHLLLYECINAEQEKRTDLVCNETSDFCKIVTMATKEGSNIIGNVNHIMQMVKLLRDVLDFDDAFDTLMSGLMLNKQNLVVDCVRSINNDALDNHPVLITYIPMDHMSLGLHRYTPKLDMVTFSNYILRKGNPEKTTPMNSGPLATSKNAAPPPPPPPPPPPLLLDENCTNEHILKCANGIYLL